MPLLRLPKTSEDLVWFGLVPVPIGDNRRTKAIVNIHSNGDHERHNEVIQ